MPSQADGTFRALADDARRAILARLAAQGPLPAGKATDGLGFSRQAGARHLDILLEAGLVREERRGREVIVTLEPHALEEVRRWMDRLAAEWEACLSRLSQVCEGAAPE